jgi:hypothetical protein
MLPPTFESGDKVVLRDDRSEIQGVVGAVQGAEITLRTEGVRRLARRTEPIPAARETLPLPPIHERLTLLSHLVEMIAHRFAPSLILVGPPGLGIMPGTGLCRAVRELPLNNGPEWSSARHNPRCSYKFRRN